MSTANVTTMLCPHCAKAGASSPLRFNGAMYQCEAGAHSFQSMEELLALHPKSISKPTPRPAPPGTQAMTVRVSTELKQALEQRFGSKLDNSLTVLATLLLDDTAFVVTGVDVQRLQEHTQLKVRSSQQLVGVLFDLVKAKNDAVEQAEKLRTQIQNMAKQRGVSAESTVVEMDEATRATVAAKAAVKNCSPGGLVAQFMAHAVKNNWL